MKDYFCSIFSQEVFYLTDACNRTPSFCNFRSTQQCIIFTCQLLRGQYLQILERFLYYSHDACSILPIMLHNTRILITANSVKEQNCVAIAHSDISTALFSLFSSTPGQQNSHNNCHNSSIVMFIQFIHNSPGLFLVLQSSILLYVVEIST